MRPHTTLNVYMMQGEEPKTVMLGVTSDISQFCEHRFYDWVIFRDKPIHYPDENTVLGRYLGLSIDVLLATKDRIMKASGEVVHHSTYHGLQENDKSSQARI